MLSTKLKYLLRVPVCTVATTSSPYSIKSKKGSFDITFKTSTHKLDAQPKAPIFSLFSQKLLNSSFQGRILTTQPWASAGAIHSKYLQLNVWKAFLPLFLLFFFFFGGGVVTESFTTDIYYLGSKVHCNSTQKETWTVLTRHSWVNTALTYQNLISGAWTKGKEVRAAQY